MPRDISPIQFSKIKTILRSNNSRCKKSAIPNAAAVSVEWYNISRFLEINLAAYIKHNFKKILCSSYPAFRIFSLIVP